MQTTTSIKTLALIGALSLCGGAAFADKPRRDGRRRDQGR